VAPPTATRTAPAERANQESLSTPYPSPPRRVPQPVWPRGRRAPSLSGATRTCSRQPQFELAMTRCHPALQRSVTKQFPIQRWPLEYTAGTAPRQVRQQDSEQLRQHRVDDRQRRRPTVGKVAIVAVPLLVGALGVGYGFTRNRDSTYRSGTPAAQVVSTTSGTVSTPAPQSPASASPIPVRPAPSPAKARPTTDPSLGQLQALVRGDASLAASKLDGRWVAFLSSKTAGIVDPLQTTESGSHKFGWSDILSEHERFRGAPPV